METVDPAILPYASPGARPRRRHFHVWLLPLMWLPGGWGACVHYGDEYFGFAMAHAPSALLVVPLIKVLGRWIPEGERWFPVVVVAGVFLWAGVGWLLDRLRAWRAVWLLAPIVFVLVVKSRIAVPGHVPPIADYPGQEWQWDAVFVAYCWSIYALAAVTLAGAIVANVVRRVLSTVKSAGPAR